MIDERRGMKDAGRLEIRYLSLEFAWDSSFSHLVLNATSKELLLDQPLARLVQPRGAIGRALEALTCQQLQGVARGRCRAIAEIDETMRRDKGDPPLSHGVSVEDSESVVGSPFRVHSVPVGLFESVLALPAVEVHTSGQLLSRPLKPISKRLPDFASGHAT
jgi:hypothetical protein